MGLHEPLDFFGMPPTDDDMVVADGMLEQIRLQINAKSDLCATEMLAVRCFDGLCLGNKIAFKLWATPFE